MLEQPEPPLGTQLHTCTPPFPLPWQHYMIVTNGNRPQAMKNYFSLLQYCTRVLYDANYSVVVCEWTQSWNSSTPPHNFSKTIYNKLLYRLLTGTNFIPKTSSLNGRNVQLACKLCRLCSAQETPPYKKGDTSVGRSSKFSFARSMVVWEPDPSRENYTHAVVACAYSRVCACDYHMRVIFSRRVWLPD